MIRAQDTVCALMCSHRLGEHGYSVVVVLHVISIILLAAGSTKASFDSSSLCSCAQHRAQLHCIVVLGH